MKKNDSLIKSFEEIGKIHEDGKDRVVKMQVDVETHEEVVKVQKYLIEIQEDIMLDDVEDSSYRR